MNNNKFMSQWKTKHEKGFVKYAIKYIVSFIIVTIIAMFFFSYINGSMNADSLYELAKYNLFFTLSYTSLMLFNWFISEKKYNRIMNDSNDNI